MGFIKRSQLRKFAFKHFGVSHSIDHMEPGYEATDVHNPSTGQNMVQYVQKYDAVEGLVIDAEWYDRKDDSGQRYVGYVLTVDVDDEVINLDFPYGKPAYRVLTRHARNIDWSRRIKFSAWKTLTKQGKPTHGVCFWQEGPDGKEAPVKSAHTIENPNGCPEPVQKLGKLDFSDAEVWLKEQFDKLCIPQIKAIGAKRAEKASAATAGADAKQVAYEMQAPSDVWDGPPLSEPYPEDEESGVPF